MANNRNHRPSSSDEEDDSDGDPDEEDPATYFTDDQDDGVKGQTIIPPDEDLDFSDIIRIDPSHAYGWKSEL